MSLVKNSSLLTSHEMSIISLNFTVIQVSGSLKVLKQPLLSAKSNDFTISLKFQLITATLEITPINNRYTKSPRYRHMNEDNVTEMIQVAVGVSEIPQSLPPPPPSPLFLHPIRRSMYPSVTDLPVTGRPPSMSVT